MNAILQFIISAISKPFRFGTSQARIIRHFRRKSNLRMQVVDDIVRGRSQISDDISPIDMVAVASLLLTEHPFDETIQTLMLFSNEGRAGRFNGDFFSALEQTCNEYKVKGFDDEANQLARAGKVMADTHGAKYWSQRYQDWLEQHFRERNRVTLRHL